MYAFYVNGFEMVSLNNFTVFRFHDTTFYVLHKAIYYGNSIRIKSQIMAASFQLKLREYITELFS